MVWPVSAGFSLTSMEIGPQRWAIQDGVPKRRIWAGPLQDLRHHLSPDWAGLVCAGCSPQHNAATATCLTVIPAGQNESLAVRTASKAWRYRPPEGPASPDRTRENVCPPGSVNPRGHR